MGEVSERAIKELATGETANDIPLVCARHPWNSSGLKLVAGGQYRFEVTNVSDWRDFFIKSTPGEGHLKFRWLFNIPPIRWLRQFKGSDWFTLIGSIDKKKDSFFFIGNRLDYVPDLTGELFTFANDAPWFYWNNHGRLRLTVTRLS